MPPIPAGHALLKFRIRLGGDPEMMICTLGVETTAASAADRVAVANSAMDSWGDNILPLQSNFYALNGVDAVFGSASGDIPVSSTDAERFGGNADGAIPQNTAILVKKVTGLGGRRNRGRMYIPGLTQEDVDNAGMLASARLAAWGTAVNNFLLGIESGSFMDRAVVFHSSGDLTPAIVEDLVVDARVATQRRRLRP